MHIALDPMHACKPALSACMGRSIEPIYIQLIWGRRPLIAVFWLHTCMSTYRSFDVNVAVHASIQLDLYYMCVCVCVYYRCDIV